MLPSPSDFASQQLSIQLIHLTELSQSNVNFNTGSQHRNSVRRRLSIADKKKANKTFIANPDKTRLILQKTPADQNRHRIFTESDASLPQEWAKEKHEAMGKTFNRMMRQTNTIQGRDRTVKQTLSQSKSGIKQEFERSASLSNERDPKQHNDGYSSLKLKTEPSSIHKKFSVGSIEAGRQTDGQQIKLKAKGGLKFTHIQNWLNNVLLESGNCDRFDKAIELCALKHFYVDPNSLLAQGLSRNDVERLYNGLFVYSVGFNNLLRETLSIKSHSTLFKSLWKIYSFLLEYCAGEDYRTAIGNIERDRILELSHMRSQLESKQHLIDNNEVINEEKNRQIFKEIRRLREENFNMGSEREILLSDFHTADTAYSQQVTLRLKFENKINEIYSLHRQLGLKHTQLFEQLAEGLQQLKALTQTHTRTREQYQVCHEKLLKLTEEHQDLTLSESRLKIEIAQLTQDRLDALHKQTVSKGELDASRSQLEYVTSVIEQQKHEITNLQATLQFRENSCRETFREYQITLQQNNRLYLVVNEQRIAMEELLKEKKAFNTKVLDIVSENSFQARKVKELNDEIHNQQQNIANLSQKMRILQVDQEHSQLTIESLKSDLTSAAVKIRQMHETNYGISAELNRLQKYQVNIDVILNHKDEEVKSTKVVLEKTRDELGQVKQSFKNLQSKHYLLEFQLKAEVESNLKRYQTIKSERTQLETKEQRNNAKINLLENQLQRYKILLNDAIVDCKNQKFERNTLYTNYQHLLRVLEGKNSQIRQQLIKINEHEEEMNDLRAHHKQTELTFLNRQDQLTNQVRQLSAKCDRLTSEVILKAQYVHPMLFDQAQMRMMANNQKYRLQLKQHEDKCSAIKTETQTLKQKFDEFKKKSEQKAQKEAKISEDMLQRKDLQIDYLRKTNALSSMKLSELELLEQQYRLLISQKSASERDQQHKAIIESLKINVNKLQDQIKENEKGSQQQIKEREGRCQVLSHDLFQLKVEHNKQTNLLNQRYKTQIESINTQKLHIEQSLQSKLDESENQHRTKDGQLAAMETQLQQSLARIAVLSSQKERSSQFGKTDEFVRIKMAPLSPASKKRRSMSRTIRNAYQYYKKE